MARRGRASSPSRGSSAFGRGRSPSPSARAAPAAPPRAVAPQPASQVAQPAPMAAAPGGGMMANIASTAAGVAIGHTVGHALTGALMGGNHGEQQAAAPVEQQATPQETHYQQPLAGQNPCKIELDQFINCAQTQSNDLSLCEGFNQVLKECKVRYGQMYQ